MARVLLLLTLVFIFSCKGANDQTPPGKKREVETSSKKVTKKDTKIELEYLQKWSDSLFNSLGKVQAGRNNTPSMQQAQERFPKNYTESKSFHLYIKGDTLSCDEFYHILTVDELGDLVQKMDSSYVKYSIQPEDTLWEKAPWTVFLSIRRNTPTQTALKTVTALTQAGYTNIAFVGKLNDPNPLPSLPDSAYYDWLYKQIDNVPAARRTTQFADLASKRYLYHPKIRKLFDKIANVDGHYNRTKVFCKEMPPLMVGKEDVTKLQTLLYAWVTLRSRRDRNEKSARSFIISESGKSISLPSDGLWQEASSILYTTKEEMINIAVPQQQETGQSE